MIEMMLAVSVTAVAEQLAVWQTAGRLEW